MNHALNTPSAFDKRALASARRRVLLALPAALATLCVLSGNAAMAATATDTIQVSATAIDQCRVSANDLAFGNYDPLSTTATAGTTTLTVTCTLNTTYDVGLDAGTGAGATVTERKMTSGADTLNYSLYQDAAYTTIWGNTPGNDTVSGTGTGAGQDYTVYGRIPAQQNVPPGNYADTVTVTVTF